MCLLLFLLLTELSLVNGMIDRDEEARTRLMLNKQQKDLYGMSLPEAAASGDVAMCEVLLKNGADVNAFGYPGTTYDGTPLIEAIRWNKKECFDFILKQENINVNLANKTGKNALHFAARRSREKMVDALLLHQNRADVNARDHEGYTPLVTLIRSHNAGDLDAFNRILEDEKFDVNIVDNWGKTALDHVMAKYAKSQMQPTRKMITALEKMGAKRKLNEKEKLELKIQQLEIKNSELEMKIQQVEYDLTIEHLELRSVECENARLNGENRRLKEKNEAIDRKLVELQGIQEKIMQLEIENSELKKENEAFNEQKNQNL